MWITFVSPKGQVFLQDPNGDDFDLVKNIWFKIGSRFTELRNMKNLDILKEALKIPHQHINFIIFSIFTSLPYFCFSVFFELVLHETLLNTFNFFKPASYYSYYDRDFIAFHVDQQRLMGNLSGQWIKLCFLYLVPCHLLWLLNIAVTVNAASMIYTAEKPISLRDMTEQKIRLKGPFITSIYGLLLSTCILLGLVGVVTNYIQTMGFAGNHHYYSLHDYFFYSSITIFHVSLFIALLVKYSEWSAGWNMALVISVLEGTDGIEAFEISAYFSKGSSRRGLVLMLVFVAWEIMLRLASLFGSCSERVGGFLFISVCNGLICMGNMMKWVVCVVYFFDCKKRILEKKVDEEVGRDVRVVNA